LIGEKAAPSRIASIERYGEQVMDLKELEAIVSREMAKHGLQGWSFGLANTKRRLGVCKVQSKRIEIAEFYALNNPPESVLDTLLHEIAHALAGPRAGHGPKWKSIASQLGATPRACDNSAETAVKPGDWQATCSACKRVIHRYKRPMSLTGYRCHCATRSPLMFEFKGNPKLKPFVPITIEESANWEAKCAGCGAVHFRLRRPKRGIWRCKCPHQCELNWRRRSQRMAHQ
jgi:predicted SprT family Zn-dependent metalloprotease